MAIRQAMLSELEESIFRDFDNREKKVKPKRRDKIYEDEMRFSCFIYKNDQNKPIGSFVFDYDLSSIEEYVQKWSENRKYYFLYKTPEMNGSRIFWYDHESRFNADWNKPIQNVQGDTLRYRVEILDQCSFHGEDVPKIMRLAENYMKTNPGIEFYIYDWTMERQRLTEVSTYHHRINRIRKGLDPDHLEEDDEKWREEEECFGEHIKTCSKKCSWRVACGKMLKWKMRWSYAEAIKRVIQRKFPDNIVVVKE